MKLEEKENIEIEFWKNTKSENPSKFTRGNFLNKTGQLQIFNKKILNHIAHIRTKERVLELGAGQGWASCFTKRFFLPNAHFTVTDISPYAIESLPYWENVFDVKINDSFASRSYKVSRPDNSFDLIFCFAAAHHFVKVEETLTEVHRLLKKGGCCIFFYEPTCSKAFYKMHFNYVNRQRPEIPEDVLITKDIKKLAESLDFEYKHVYDHNSQYNPSIAMTLYFKLIRTLPFLQSMLPSSSDFIFTKKGSS